MKKDLKIDDSTELEVSQPSNPVRDLTRKKTLQERFGVAEFKDDAYTKPPLAFFHKRVSGFSTCIACGQSQPQSAYYRNYSILGDFKTNDKGNFMGFCKKCLKAIFWNHVDQEEMSYKKALMTLCIEFNYYIDTELIDKLLKQGDIADKLPEAYLDEVLTNDNKSKYYNKSLINELNYDSFEIACSDKNTEDFYMSDEDKKNRNSVMATFLYDPFKDRPLEEKSLLYRNLSLMIDESMATDPVRQNAALQVVNYYADIDVYNKQIQVIKNKSKSNEETNGLLSPEDIETIDNLNDLCSKISKIIEAQCKGNEFTERFKKGNSKSTGTLGGIMRDADEKNVDSMRTNYYDILTSKSLAECASVSAKSIINQLKLTDQDFASMVGEQREELEKLTEENNKLKEKIRLIKYTIAKDKLMRELRIKLKEKNIPDDEIDEVLDIEIVDPDKRV